MMGRWILRGAAAAALLAAAGAGAYEMRGRALRREDAARNAPCVDGSQIRLKDKCLFGFRLSGRPTDRPVLYFHGALGSRLEWPANPESVAEARVWLIAVDRPGYGCSDPAPTRRVPDFTDDVRQLADRLRIGRFRIVAWSAGTVYAMACAWRMPDRVTRLDLIGAVVPENYPEGQDQRDQDLAFFARLAQWAPGTTYALLRRTLIRRETAPEW